MNILKSLKLFLFGGIVEYNPPQKEKDGSYILMACQRSLLKRILG